MKKLHLLFFTSLAILISGCASIVDGGNKTVQVTSNPPGAQFAVYNSSGKFIITQTTPAIVTLPRSDGWFVPASYKLICDKEGYHSDESHIRAILSPWYFGNIIFGGLIGIVIVDPATGAMWVLNKKEVNFDLSPIGILPEQKAANEAYAAKLKSSLQHTSNKSEAENTSTTDKNP